MGGSAPWLLVLLVGCPQPIPTTRPSAETRHVMLTFQPGTTAVATMTADGDVVLPPTCNPAPPDSRASLCTPAFRKLAHDRGGASAHLVDMHDDARGATYVMAAVVEGSGECGSYGFWVIRVDRAIRITQPITGCFALSTDKDAGAVTPVVTWGSPLRLTALTEGGQKTSTFELDELTYAFVSTK
jgi:hypothetical protein